MNWWAHLDALRFTFDAFSPTEDGARENLRRAWEIQRRRGFAGWTWEQVEPDVKVICISLGGVWKDRELWGTNGK